MYYLGILEISGNVEACVETWTVFIFFVQSLPVYNMFTLTVSFLLQISERIGQSAHLDLLRKLLDSFFHNLSEVRCLFIRVFEFYLPSNIRTFDIDNSHKTYYWDKIKQV